MRAGQRSKAHTSKKKAFFPSLSLLLIAILKWKKVDTYVSVGVCEKRENDKQTKFVRHMAKKKQSENDKDKRRELNMRQNKLIFADTFIS